MRTKEEAQAFYDGGYEDVLCARCSHRCGDHEGHWSGVEIDDETGAVTWVGWGAMWGCKLCDCKKFVKPKADKR